MINRELLEPKSIVVIGGSNNVHKPGGAVVRNLQQGGYKGTLRIVNPKEDEVQGIKASCRQASARRHTRGHCSRNRFWTSANNTTARSSGRTASAC